MKNEPDMVKIMIKVIIKFLVWCYILMFTLGAGVYFLLQPNMTVRVLGASGIIASLYMISAIKVNVSYK